MESILAQPHSNHEIIIVNDGAKERI
ncbi:glycosyltransferase family A protein [Bacteroides congonensis]